MCYSQISSYNLLLSISYTWSHTWCQTHALWNPAEQNPSGCWGTLIPVCSSCYLFTICPWVTKEMMILSVFSFGAWSSHFVWASYLIVYINMSKLNNWTLIRGVITKLNNVQQINSIWQILNMNKQVQQVFINYLLIKNMKKCTVVHSLSFRTCEWFIDQRYSALQNIFIPPDFMHCFFYCYTYFQVFWGDFMW